MTPSTPDPTPAEGPLSPTAYDALREALPRIVWYRAALETFLRARLSEHPELLVGLPFNARKRDVADQLINRMLDNKARYRAAAADLLADIAQMEQFPNIEKIPDSAEREKWLHAARTAVAEVRQCTCAQRAVRAQQTRRAAQAQHNERMQQQQQFADTLAALQQRFVQLHAMNGKPQERGRLFEALLNDLFAAHDLRPRLPYALHAEQIDGAFSFDTDDYIVEAKWTKLKTSRDEMDTFACKVQRRGKNALGLFVSLAGFSPEGLNIYSTATPFIAVTGYDLALVLENRVGLADLLRAKKRHANETGSCMLPASTLLSSV